MSPLKVLVYGATGSQSRPLVLKLLEKGHQPTVLTRHPDKAADLQAAGAHIAIGSLDDTASLNAASEGQQLVTLLIPAFLDNPLNATMYARNAIDAAKAAGVGGILWNMSGPLPTERSGNPMNDSRLEVLDYLRSSGVAHITFEPTGYIENLLGPWTVQSIIERNQVSYPLPSNRKVGWLPSADLGSIMAAAAERLDLAGSHFKVSGIEAVTGLELAQIFSQVLDRELTYYQMTPEEMGAVIDKMFGPGAGEAVANSYRKELDMPTLTYHDMSLVLDKFPVQMTRISEWITQHVSAFQPMSETRK